MNRCSRAFPPTRCIFDEEKSLFFEEKNGTIILARTCPQVGGAYDGSAI